MFTPTGDAIPEANVVQHQVDEMAGRLAETGCRFVEPLPPPSGVIVAGPV